MSTTVIGRPLPNVEDHLYGPYLAGLLEHKLMVQRCSVCGHWQWPPREFCFACHRPSLEWVESEQVGAVYTYTICYRAFHPWFKDHLPYAIVVGELPHGIRVLAPYFDSDVESIECGMQVRAAFDEMNASVTLMRWTRA